MSHYDLMLSLLIAGFALLGVGFTFREHEWGIWIISLGAVTTLLPIGLGVYWALN